MPNTPPPLINHIRAPMHPCTSARQIVPLFRGIGRDDGTSRVEFLSGTRCTGGMRDGSLPTPWMCMGMGKILFSSVKIDALLTRAPFGMRKIYFRERKKTNRCLFSTPRSSVFRFPARGIVHKVVRQPLDSNPGSKFCSWTIAKRVSFWRK